VLDTLAVRADLVETEGEAHALRRWRTLRNRRHSVAGRIGRGAKPPPQFGQTFFSVVSTQSAQKVHS
jgi:hypothetical protein